MILLECGTLKKVRTSTFSRISLRDVSTNVKTLDIRSLVIVPWIPVGSNPSVFFCILMCCVFSRNKYLIWEECLQQGRLSQCTTPPLKKVFTFFSCSLFNDQTLFLSLHALLLVKIIELVLIERSSRKTPVLVYFFPKTTHLGLAMQFFHEVAELTHSLPVISHYDQADLKKLFLLVINLQEMMRVLYMEDAVANLKDTDISPGKLITLFQTTNFQVNSFKPLPSCSVP